jgi:predicted ATP-dependent endonuclease of OLD family
LDNTVVLFKNDEKKIEHHYLLNGFSSKAKDLKKVRFLRKYLNATNSTMFYARKVILVEGISELLLIPELFKRYNNGETLEKHGCTIINVNGLAFKNFLDIIKNGFFIKCLVLTDRDTGTIMENRGENLKKEYSTYKESISIAITEDSTFEKDIISYNSLKEKGKEILIEAINLTRPIKAKKVIDTETPLDTEIFFSLIEETTEKEKDGKTFYTKGASYKSEFAFNLANLLSQEGKTIRIPSYIADGFKFLLNTQSNG